MKKSLFLLFAVAAVQLSLDAQLLPQVPPQQVGLSKERLGGNGRLQCGDAHFDVFNLYCLGGMEADAPGGGYLRVFRSVAGLASSPGAPVFWCAPVQPGRLASDIGRSRGRRRMPGLCTSGRHKPPYAELRIMPSSAGERQWGGHRILGVLGIIRALTGTPEVRRLA